MLVNEVFDKVDGRQYFRMTLEELDFQLNGNGFNVSLDVIGTVRGNDIESIMGVAVSNHDLTWFTGEDWSWGAIVQEYIGDVYVSGFQDLLDEGDATIIDEREARNEINGFHPKKKASVDKRLDVLDLTLESGSSNIDVSVSFNYSPPERQTYDYPGAPEEFEVDDYFSSDGYDLRALLDDVEIEMDGSDLADHFYDGP